MRELAPFPTTIPGDWIQGREDLRRTLTCTVDPPTAKDFDDAISLEVLPKAEGGGWLLGVHIADVSHYVAEDGPLDEEARLRGTSVYFPDEAIPMLPERSQRRAVHPAGGRGPPHHDGLDDDLARSGGHGDAVDRKRHPQREAAHL